jgi:hypothetical protein
MEGVVDKLVTPIDRRELLPQPIEDSRSLPAKQKREWIKQMTHVIYTRHKNNLTRSNLTDICTFFQPAHNAKQHPA